jgi:hypothetical protein
MIARLVTTALCAACVVLLATRDPVRIQVVRQLAPPPAADRPPRLSVIDVAADVAPASVPALVGLRRHEWIKAINDQAPHDDFEAEQMLQALARRGGFLDLTVVQTVGRDAAERRVLMLIH